MKWKLIEVFYGQGHEYIQATHRTTIELTKENFVTKNGDCIIGINSQKSCFDLAEKTKEKLKSKRKFRVILKSGVESDTFFGFGHENLILNNLNSMVFRKSNYICDRTIMIKCNKSAIDLDRSLINFLKNANTQLLIEIYMDEGF